MKNKKITNFYLIIVALGEGFAINQQFDYKNLKFKNPALAVIFIVVFVLAIYLLIKDYIKPTQNDNDDTELESKIWKSVGEKHITTKSCIGKLDSKKACI